MNPRCLYPASARQRLRHSVHFRISPYKTRACKENRTPVSRGSLEGYCAPSALIASISDATQINSSQELWVLNPTRSPALRRDSFTIDNPKRRPGSLLIEGTVINIRKRYSLQTRERREGLGCETMITLLDDLCPFFCLQQECRIRGQNKEYNKRSSSENK